MATELPLRTIIGITQYDRIISLGGSGGIDGGYYGSTDISLDFLQTPVGVHWGKTGPSGSPPPKPVKPCQSGNWSWRPVLIGAQAQYNLTCPFNQNPLYFCPPGGATPDFFYSTYPKAFTDYIGAGCNWSKSDNNTPPTPWCAFDNQCFASGLFCDVVNNPGGLYTVGIGWQQVDTATGLPVGGFQFGRSADPGCFFPSGGNFTPSNNTGTSTAPPNITQPNNGFNIPGQMFAPWPKGS